MEELPVSLACGLCVALLPHSIDSQVVVAEVRDNHWPPLAFGRSS